MKGLIKMNALVFQSDFGLGDGAVSAMHGVARMVNSDLIIDDLTHDIKPYNIFEASYRILQTIEYWPKGTVFVSVVDLSLIHISEPTRRLRGSRMPSSA